MEVNIQTKFNVGDYAYRNYFSGHHLIEILGIEIHIEKNDKIEVYYQFKPYFDSRIIDVVREESLLTEQEIESK